MKKLLFAIIFISASLYSYSQSPDPEMQAMDNNFKAGKLSAEQVNQLKKKCFDFIASYKYPKFTVSKKTGEIDISDTLTFSNKEKKVIFQRCLQWIAINYGNLVYSDLESGKIIATGLIDLNHFQALVVGIGRWEISQTQAPTNYTLILTLKDNKIKYTITNIDYTFTIFANDTSTDVSFPISALFPIVTKDPLEWVKSISILNETTDKFYYNLKNSLVDFINDSENDYNF